VSKRCLGCMELFGDEFEICPHCGHVVGTHAEEAIHIEPGTLLYDRYIVGKVLGYGGFGVTYLGWDGKLEQKVAIKEYLPGEFSTRMPGQSQVTVFNGEKNEQFYDGLKKFIEEAKHLAKFQNEQGIVKIFDSFEENDTAYIIMEYLDGETLTEYLKREKTIPEDVAVAMMMPVMASLQVVHEEGLLHRDIAPDNIFLTKSGEVKLIDFGASRYATTSHSRSLTVIIKPGYSPEEQYRSKGDQGPHTDVYAIASTLYKMITGKTPPDAMERRAKYENQDKDILEEPHKINKKISPNRENAILNAMNVRIEDRTPDIATFIKDLNADPPVKRIYGKIKKIDLYSWPLWLKVTVPAMLSVVLVFGSLLLTGIIKFSNFTEEIVIPDNIVAVPDVEGLFKDEAFKLITEGKLLASSDGSIESEYIPAGKIILQTPVGGSYMDINGTVLLMISSGKGVALPENGISVVPHVIWDDIEDASAKLAKAGLVVEKVLEVHDELVAYGSVVSQSLEAGTQVPEGSKLTLTISKGPAAFDMPNVVGQSKENAESTLSGKGLVVMVEYIKTDEVAEGNVVSQSVSAGMSVKRGDQVTIIVSSGRETVDVVDVIGKTQAEAEAALKAQGFKVTALENYDANVAAGNVISQTPGAGTAQLPGTTIVIYISKGKQPVTVTYDANGGSVGTGSKNAFASDAYGKLPIPTRNGYTFAGWYTAKSEGTMVTENTTITAQSNHTLYAIWKANSYTVSFNANGGSVSPTNKKVEYASAYGDLPTPTRTGYGFVGWYTEDGTTVTADKIFSSPKNITLTAKWAAREFTVKWNTGNGYAITVTRTASPNAGAAIGKLSVGTDIFYGDVLSVAYTASTGYTITANGKTAITVTGNVTASDIYATAKVNSYKLTFDANGGNVSTTSKSVSYGSTYGTLPTPTRTGYSFAGWYTAVSGGTKVTASTTYTATYNQTLYARWKAEGYTVTFNANKGSVSTASKSVSYGSAYGTLPAPTRAGYSFDGWYTAVSGGTKVTENTTYTVTSNQTLYAHWTVKTYTLTLDANGGSVSPSSKTIAYGSTYGTLPTPTRAGYSFDGWYTAASGGTKVTENTTYTVASNQTLYAHWTVKVYTLTFDTNGGSVSPSSKTIAYGSPLGALPTPTRSYYEFIGWYADSTDSSLVDQFTSMGAGDVTIYARWRLKDLSSWVLASNVPSGAEIVDEKWTYTRTQYTESTDSSLNEWMQIGSYWNQTGSGSTNYASFPSGYDTNNKYYKEFAKAPYSAYDDGSTKREVTNTWVGYIYWHWMYNCYYANRTDRTIANARGTYPNTYGYYYFYAIASTVDCRYLSHDYSWQSQASYNCHDIIPQADKNNGVLGLGTPRFYRFDYYTSSYVDYEKVYQYQKVTTDIESWTQVSAGGEISNVQHYVRYREK